MKVEELSYINMTGPSTRYRGSKRKLISWLFDNLINLEFDTVLDAFGGTGMVGYMFKKMGKKVTYNDVLKFNYYIGKSIIENQNVIITENELEKLLQECSDHGTNSLITNEFSDIYYLDEENEWLDSIISIINYTWNDDDNASEYKKAIALNALFQSCLVKRPYNLFHRNNLNIRLADVKRTFGNKVTWDSSFEFQFTKFVKEINCSVFDTKNRCISLNEDAFLLEDMEYDLVYIDPPYLDSKGSSESTDYLSLYHFLEGICKYDYWKNDIDYNKSNRGLNSELYKNHFNKKNILESFHKLIYKFRNSIIVLSYKSNGIPKIEDITEILLKYKNNVSVHSIDYKYALNKKSIKSDYKELLFIAK